MMKASFAKNVFPVPGLYGLVVCGGNSRRMGTDKGLLTYHQKPQRYHLYEMLVPICEKVFISCNATQATGTDHKYPIMPDLPEYNNIGPMAALLTAFRYDAGKDFLMIGCDYPLLTIDELVDFVSMCHTEKRSAAFYNETAGFYEPLLAYYHHSIMDKLMEVYRGAQYSLQHVLQIEHAAKYYPADINTISSIDTINDFIKLKQVLYS